jgi:dienelactone hydrolase
MPENGRSQVYFCDGLEYQSVISYPNTKGKSPCVIVAHAWMGQDDFAKNKAKELSSLGYVGFAADLYGGGAVVSTKQEALSLMLPLFLNRRELRRRIVAAVDAAKKDPLVDPKRIGAIGFCFGGLTVLELLRSGIDIRGVVSFHGVLANALEQNAATLEPNNKNIAGSCLILHGFDDPMMTEKDLFSIQKELTTMNIDWQMHVFGKTMHAFTNPEANEPTSGLLYNPTAEKRSWNMMKEFFKEVFV